MFRDQISTSDSIMRLSNSHVILINEAPILSLDSSSSAFAEEGFFSQLDFQIHRTKDYCQIKYAYDEEEDS